MQFSMKLINTENAVPKISDVDEILASVSNTDAIYTREEQQNIETSSSNIKTIKNEHFSTICDAVIENPQSLQLPDNWICQFIGTGEKCIMRCHWKISYIGIAKRVVLFTDMLAYIYIDEVSVVLDDFDKIENIKDIKKLITFLSNNVFIC